MINVITVFGRYRAVAASPRALFMLTVLMTVMLMRSRLKYLASYISCATAAFIPLYVFFFVRVSEFIINPAGTTGWLFCMAVHGGMSLLRRHSGPKSLVWRLSAQSESVVIRWSPSLGHHRW